LGVVAYDVDSDIYGLQGRLGYQSANVLGAEVEGSFGVIDDKETVGATELKAGVDYSVGAFARAVVPLGERFNVFARGGYHATRIDGSVTDATGTVKVADTTDGFAYGAGAEWAFNPRDSIRLDYTRYDLGPGETDSVSLAYSRKF
jgi:opacity protein-like surface antigen